MSVTPNRVTIALEIENCYDSGNKVVTKAITTIDPPPADRESQEYDDWEYNNIYCETGTGQESGDSAYFVLVTASSDPDAIPVGTEYEFGL